jgi:alpha-tubulin suppressor-like RCC1 family protein
MSSRAQRRICTLFCSLLTAACAEPFVPNVGVPTLDDPAAGSYVAVSAGLEHTCALTTDGTAYCWGSNEFGQLGAPGDTTCLRGDRNIECRRRPQAVAGDLKFVKISAGGRHTCAIATTSRIYCWGDNLRGGLGDPSIRGSAVPNPIVGTAAFIDVVAGGQHSCGLRADGIAFCWGDNGSGQIGTGLSGLGSASPDSVRTTTRFASLAAGEQRTCGRAGDGAVFCWGAFWVTRLNGAEVTRAQAIPQRVQPGPLFKSMTVGTNTTCGIATQSAGGEENVAFCWEANPTGSMGDGSASGSTSPRPVPDIRLVAVSSGALQTCGIADSGFAYCWGAGTFGQLGVSSAFLSTRCGNGRVPCSTLPIRVSGWRVFSSITAGQGDHACGLTVAGNVYCWGAGSMGQRGDGSTTAGEWSPVRIAPAGQL